MTGLDTPFVGRAAELGTLHDALRAAASGRAGAVLVAGEAGVGKTRLVHALLEELDESDTLVLRAQCVDLGEPGLPFLAVRDLVEAVGAVGDEIPAAAVLLASRPAATHLVELSGPGVADVSPRPQLLHEAATLLGGVARIRPPALVVVEDLQWADASTADFLRFLLTRVTDEPLLVIVTVRTDGAGRRPQVRRWLGELHRLPAVRRLDLRPFDRDEVAHYLGALLAEELPAGVVGDIGERTGGNAFYLQSIVQGLQAGMAFSDIPGALADVLVARVETLTQDAQRVVRSAAVAGGVADPRLLAAVTGIADDRLDAALRELVGDRMLVPDGDHYTFVHGLLREALADDLQPAERMRLHAAYAAALASGVVGLPVPAEMAHHLLAAADNPAALTWSVRAAEAASQVPAPVEALAHLDRSLALWDAVADAPDRTGITAGELARRAARAAAQAGEPQRAVGLARRAVHLSEAGDSRVQALLELARDLLDVDRVDEAVDQAQLAVSAAEDEAPTLQLTARTVLARSLLAARRLAPARQQAELARAELGGSVDPALEIDLLVTLAMLDEIDGDRAGSAAGLRSALERTLTVGEPTAELRVRYALACSYFYNGDVDGALPVLREAAARLAESGLRWSGTGVELRILDVVARYVAGDLAGSLAASAAGPSSPPDVAAARLTAVSCYAAVARGEPDVAQRFDVLRGQWHLEPQVGLVAGGCEADHLTWIGDHDAAVAMAERAQQHLDTTAGEGMYGGLWLSALALSALAERATVARSRRDADALATAVANGAALLDRVRRLADLGHGRPGDLGPEGAAWLARAEAEHARLTGGPAVPQWEQAVQAFGFGYGYEQARCRWRLAEALVAVGERDAARDAAAAALTAAAAMGAAPLQRAVQATISRSRLDPDAAAASRPLTARELEVLTLVAEGLTNRAIGQRLYISEKTASVHLSNAMSKLGVAGRTEAVTVAHRRGLLDIAGS